jgi:phage terminase large subunit-like protein
MKYAKKYFNRMINNELGIYKDIPVKKQINVSKSIFKIYNRVITELEDPNGKYYFDEHEAELAISFIENFCVHTKGSFATGPLKDRLFKLELWQKAYLELIFGVLRKKDNTRRFRTVFLLIARKNGKTAIAGTIALKTLMVDFEEGAEIYSVATKKDQAQIVFKVVRDMISKHPALSKKIKRLKNELVFEKTLSSMKALSSDSNTLDGLNPHFCNIDEMHAIKDRNIYDVITSALGSRKQPLIMITTTNGTTRESLFDEEYDYALNVVNETFEDDEYLPLLYELDKTDDWTDSSVWEKPNPNIGVSLSKEYLDKQVQKAINSAAARTGVLTKHFNIKQTSKNRFLDFRVIERNNQEIPIERIINKYCVIGIDLSQTKDLTCVNIRIPFNAGDLKDKFFDLPLFFIPAEIAEEKQREDGVPYERWYQDGYVYYSPSRTVKQEYVFEVLIETLKKYELTPIIIGYDDWYAHELTKALEQAGFELSKVIQGFKTLSSPMRNLEGQYESSQIIYNNNPCMRWNIANVSAEQDARENIKPVKTVKRQRIDGFVAQLISQVVYERVKDHFNIIEQS